MKKALVTGGTGYLGSHLIDSLQADGIDVRALVYSDWKAEELAGRGVEVVLGDITEPETLEGIARGVDAVFHLVGGGSDGRRDPFEINTQATRNLVDACRGVELGAFVYVSSSSVYGRQADFVDEETKPAPRFDYPQSKLDAEELLLEEARKNNLPAMVARMAGIYGPDAPMLGIKLVQKGGLHLTGDGSNAISVIYVEDAVRGLRAMADRAAAGHTGEIFCLSDDEPVETMTFHSYFAELMGSRPPRITSIKRLRFIIGVLKFLSRMVGRKAPLTEAVIEMSTLEVKMKNDRMRNVLGVELLYPTYRQGLAQVVEAILMDEEE
ncbi:MAG: NAD-dependent epimerase/dehydratase family protein [Anaerolineales bacterium]|nr:NAD-dependent epimerase/dehydratase family protein [Anaerolineales bacterium]